MGYQAAYNLYSGSNTIEIGNMGGPGDNNLVRIGSTQTATFIAGIAGAKVTGSAVYVTSSGQLGVLASSERYKTAIVRRQLYLPVTTLISAGLWASSSVHHRAV